jgi:AAA+ superfamily predicted ATPase
MMLGGQGAPEPYRSSEEHLHEELHRIYELLRARTVVWRETIAETKPEQFWGLVNVTDAEIERFLKAPYAPPGRLREPGERHRRAAAELEERIKERVAITSVPLRLELIRERFGLTALARDVLLVCLLPLLDERYRRLLAYLRDDASRRLPSVELVLQVLRPDDPAAAEGWQCFAPHGRLRSRALVRVTGEGPLPQREVALEDRVAAFLRGNDAVDGQLAGFTRMLPGLDWGEFVLPEDRLGRLRALADHWTEQPDEQQKEPRGVVFLQGPYGSGRGATARALAAATRTQLLAMDTEAALGSSKEWLSIVQLVYREAVLQDAAPLWRDVDGLLAEDRRLELDALLEAAETFQGLSFLTSLTPFDPAHRFRTVPFVRVGVPMPGYDQRTRLWSRRLEGTSLESSAPALANDFHLTPGQIEDAFATARWHVLQRAATGGKVTLEDVYEGCRRQSSRRLVAFARRVEPRPGLTYDDLILPAPNRRQLEELRARIRNRGRAAAEVGLEQRLHLGGGLIVLFTGSSGTGKTMSASLLAQEQNVDLYKVDLAAIVSKWVGETEKNLDKLFGDAEDANAILFFDEADALFGRRGEVKEAQDRWANLETNFLLQRVEEYHGVVILASNLRQNLDPAFLRRIHAIVEYPFPDAASRLEIWRRTLPSGVTGPPEKDLQLLAERFDLSGGSIRNVVIDALYRAIAAAGNGTPEITGRHLVAGIAREYQKLGRPLTRAGFSPELHEWVEEDVLLSSLV